MRHDMVKVLFEPARAGSSNPSVKTGFRIRGNNGSELEKLENSPKYIPASQCKRKSGFSKESIGLDLGPLQGFLKANVSRLWNKVYADFCRRVDKRTYAGNEAMEYLKREVLTDCVIGDKGKIYGKGSYGIYRPVDEFYVHPQTGLLQWAKPNRYRYRAGKPSMIKIEFISSVEAVFWGKNTKYPYGWSIVRKIKTLSSPSFLHSKRYAKTVIEKTENGWRINCHEPYDPEEVISRIQTPQGEVTKRRKDCLDLPTTYVVRTKTPNKKEMQEINRLLSLLDKNQEQKSSDSASKNCHRPPHSRMHAGANL